MPKHPRSLADVTPPLVGRRGAALLAALIGASSSAACSGGTLPQAVDEPMTRAQPTLEREEMGHREAPGTDLENSPASSGSTLTDAAEADSAALSDEPVRSAAEAREATTAPTVERVDPPPMALGGSSAEPLMRSAAAVGVGAIAAYGGPPRHDRPPFAPEPGVTEAIERSFAVETSGADEADRLSVEEWLRSRWSHFEARGDTLSIIAFLLPQHGTMSVRLRVVVEHPGRMAVTVLSVTPRDERLRMVGERIAGTMSRRDLRADGPRIEAFDVEVTWRLP